MHINEIREEHQNYMKHKILRRYAVFLTGILFMGLGIALTAKSDLGTSPISSIPYVCSVIFPWTFGQFTVAYNVLFFLIEYLLLRKDFSRFQFLQLLICPFFGFFTDLGMHVFAAVAPSLYLAKIGVLLAGTVILAFGIYLQVTANVLINPGEGLVKAISFRTKIPFGNIKVAFDSTLAIIACAISFTALAYIVGIREGTVINALLVGLIVKKFHWLAHFIKFEQWLLPKGLIYLKDLKQN